MSKPTKLNGSLTGRTLFYIVTGLVLILVSTSTLNYVLTRQEVEKNLRIQMQDQIQRIGRSQQEVLLLGKDMTTAIREIAKRELGSASAYDVDKRYHELFMRYPDGAIRSRPEYGDGALYSTLWAPATTQDNAMFRRLFVVFYDLCQQYGPVVRTRFLNLYYVARNGANIAYDPEVPSWVYDAPADYNPTDQNWVNYGWPENNPNRATLTTPPEHDPIPNLDIVSIITPLDVQGEYLGSVGLTMRYDVLINEFGKSIIPQSTQVLFRRDGVLIAHSEHRQEILGGDGELNMQHLGDERLVMLYGAAITAKNLPEVSYNKATNSYYAVTRLEGTDWYTANLVPASVVTDKASVAAQWVLWSSFLSLLLLVTMLATILNRQVARPLKKLAATAQQIAAGDLDVRLTVEHDDEVGDLTTAISHMVGQLQLRDHANTAEKNELANALESTRTTEMRFRALLEYAADVIIVLDDDGIMRFIAPSVEKATGFTIEEWAGRPGISVVHPDDQVLATRALSRLMINPDEIVTNLEFRIQHKDGRWQYYSATGINQLSNQTVRGIVINAHNIDEKKRHEEDMQKQQEALYQSEKLTSMGALLAGVAHELNNPLSVVVGWALMLEAESTDDQSRHALEKLRGSAERCARIVKTFLAMAKHTKPKREICNINDIIFLALDITSYILRTTGVEVVQDIDQELPDINADPDQLHQVFVNLLINAQQAMSTWPGESRITINTRHDPITRTVTATIHDSGPGIAENIRTMIFEPFYTTKPSGTGIGLSVSRGLVRSNNGTIELAAQVSPGAVFNVSFPVVTEADLLDQNLLSEQRTTTTTTTRTVLVVDDEQDICEISGKILRNEGHKVYLAGDANQALRLIEELPIDIIVSDMRMPGLDGQGLYRILTTVAPVLTRRIIFVTGDTLSYDIMAFFNDVGCPYLEKPIHPKELVSMIESMSIAMALE